LFPVEGKRTLKENIIKGLSLENRAQGAKAFDELVRRNLITLKHGSKGVHLTPATLGMYSNS
jgi:hypothetical protein